MSKSPNRSGSAFNPQAWIVPGVVTCTLAAAAVSYTRSAEIHAAAGSPYYSKAVQEALGGLQNPGEKPAVPAAAGLPAGTRAEDQYWCEQCKAYHKRQPADGGSQAGGAPAPAAASPGGVSPLPAPGTDAIPPLPQGLSPADYYWCVNCKTYHSRSDPKVSVAGVAAAGKEAAQPPQAEIPPSLARPVVPASQP